MLVNLAYAISSLMDSTFVVNYYNFLTALIWAYASLFLSEKALFVNNFGIIYSKTNVHKLRSVMLTISQFQ